MTIWERVRNWARIRGVDNAKSQVQYQRFLQEAVEVHDAMVKDDIDEVVDSIGDTIITLINLANTYKLDAEYCLDSAFSVIEFRKGLTNRYGDFIRYKKLSMHQQAVCDKLQGNPGSEYFSPTANLVVDNFKE